MDQIPGIFRLKIVGERWHGRSVQAGHENAVKILVRNPALKSRAHREIVGTYRIVFAVGKRAGRWTVPMTFRTMALPAFHLLKQFPAVENAFDLYRSLRWNRDRCTRSAALPLVGKRLDVGNEVRAVLVCERFPR